MSNATNDLPDSTDVIATGASATGNDFRSAIPLDSENTLRARATAAAATLRDQASERTADLRGQAGDKAREYAEQGKDKATAALDSVSKMIGDAAAQVDEKVGSEYGDYARRAAQAVDGFSATLREKDVDTLFADARELVKRSPAIAIGAAAVLGFALVRLAKSGSAPEQAAAPKASPKGRSASSSPKTGKKKA